MDNAAAFLCHIPDGYYHLMGLHSSSTTPTNKWWNEEVLKNQKDYSAEQTGITKLGENHALFLPYLMGERSAHNNRTQNNVSGKYLWIQLRGNDSGAEGVAFGL